MKILLSAISLQYSNDAPEFSMMWKVHIPLTAGLVQ